VTIRALVFDVFGTVVDWRSSIIREGELLGRAKNLKVDWAAFADAWRAGYRPAMSRTAKGEWANIDTLHRGILNEILEKFSIRGLSEAEITHLNLAWHRLDAWPDVPAAMARLKTKFWIAPCSNGNIALGVDLARRNNLHWDAILGSDVAGDFKPKPRVYLAACDAFNLPPERCMMVAAHSRDLKAAASNGLRTGHIARVDEYGPNTGEAGPTVPVDVAGKDLADLADKLGC